MTTPTKEQIDKFFKKARIFKKHRLTLLILSMRCIYGNKYERRIDMGLFDVFIKDPVKMVIDIIDTEILGNDKDWDK